MFNTQSANEFMQDTDTNSPFSEDLNLNDFLNNPIPLHQSLSTPTKRPTNNVSNINTDSTHNPSDIQNNTTSQGRPINNMFQQQDNNNAQYDVTPDQRFRQPIRHHPYQRPRENKKLTASEMLNKIYSQTTNISSQTNKNTINQLLKEGIKKEGAKEIETSLATITITKDDNTNMDIVKNIINNEWVTQHNQLLPPTWEDKKQGLIFVQFINSDTKKVFLNMIKDNNIVKNIKHGDQPESKHHYTKRPVRIEVNRVRENMNTETIVKAIKTACGENIKIMNLKEGKLHNGNKTKIIAFYTDASGLSNIADKMRWKIPYYDANKNIKANLFIKINSKPWICKECFAIGNHNCRGKCCGKCSADNHLTKDCDQQEYCPNCKTTGHCARDTHCITYINMLIRNLVQMDIPNSVYNKESRIANLIENIQLK